MNPDIKKDAWTLDEELTLLNAHRINGNKWAELAKLLPGRYRSFANLFYSEDEKIRNILCCKGKLMFALHLATYTSK